MFKCNSFYLSLLNRVLDLCININAYLLKKKDVENMLLDQDI